MRIPRIFPRKIIYSRLEKDKSARQFLEKNYPGRFSAIGFGWYVVDGQIVGVEKCLFGLRIVRGKVFPKNKPKKNSRTGRLFNFLYIWKWLFVKKWHESFLNIDQNELKQTGKRIVRESTRISKLTPGQIEGLLHLWAFFKGRKWYRVADSIRRRLTDIGYVWKEPKKWSASNLLGHTIPGLDFKISGNNATLEGHVNFQEEVCWEEISYSTSETTSTQVEVTAEARYGRLQNSL